MPVMVSQLEVYYKLDRLLTGLTAQQSITTAQRDSNKTTLKLLSNPQNPNKEMNRQEVLNQPMRE